MILQICHNAYFVLLNRFTNNCNYLKVLVLVYTGRIRYRQYCASRSSSNSILLIRMRPIAIEYFITLPLPSSRMARMISLLHLKLKEMWSND